MQHELLKKADRLVVKFGTGILTNENNLPDLNQMQRLVAQVAGQVRLGKEVSIVSSGAVGAGMGTLGRTSRPNDLASLQACAAVGQSRLMAIYESLFAEHGIVVAQVLLTHDDLEHHERHLNARNTLLTLMHQGVVPIINENDAVSFTELKFGDNDRLSALVATLLPADLLVVLTSVDGVIDGYGKKEARLISVVNKIDVSLERMAGDTNSVTGTGGMSTKIQAAKIVSRSGIPMVIGSGFKDDVLARVLNGCDEGTLFVPRPSKLKGRKRWIAFFHHPRGTLVVDVGAKKALRDGGKSLLPPGIVRCEGVFSAGDIVRICDEDGTEFARGITAFDADSVHSPQTARTEIVHRDNLVIL
ncbi:MAG: glutamate 5-kinase [Verrucomicrobia bacterium]|nr:glutamate 5-kinase [Verrucomicrobiota bacterium]MCF7708264.1 glutamate 5-kinase [Verrucomicrobiota bacterium]